MKRPGRLIVKDNLKVIGEQKKEKNITLTMDGEMEQPYAYSMADLFTMEYQAKIWGLPDHCIAIHTAASMSDLEKMERWQIENYLDYMGQHELTKTSTYKMLLYATLQWKYRFYETFKYHEYVEMNLFRAYQEDDHLINDIQGLELLHWDLEYKDDILDHGMDYYYLRIGSLTVNNLLAMFNREELMVFLVPLILAYRIPYHLRQNMTDQEVAMDIVCMADMCKYDVRNLLGPNMIWEVHNKEPSDLVLVKYQVSWKSDDLATACHNEGLRGDLLTEKQMYADYCLNMLCKPSFCKKIKIGDYQMNGDHILRHVVNVKHDKDFLFYGIRTGEHKYQMVTERELLESFKNSGEFINPYDRSIYPRYAIRKLRLLIDNEELKLIIDSMLDEFKLLKPYVLENPSPYVTASLFNFISVTMDWELLSEYHPLDAEFKDKRALLLGPEVLGNVSDSFFKSCIIMMDKLGDVGKLHIVKLLQGVVVMSSDTIGSYIVAFEKLNKYGMQRIAGILSQYLMYSWIWYFMIKSNLTVGELKF